MFNVAILKTPGFWVNLVASILGLLMASGIVLSGSTLDQILGGIVSVVGILGGHTLAAPAAPASTPPAA
jgi:hypothetical protein